MVTIGKRMLPSLEGRLKSTGKALLNMVKEGKCYDDPSLSSFDPSSNAFLHAWGYCENANARDNYKHHSILVYVELIWDQGRWVINKVGQTTNFRERRKAESYQNSHLKSVIRLDEVPVPVATALREEYTKMVQWIVNPKNEVEPPVRRLFSALIDSGADELGPARNVIAQLL